MIAIGGQIDRFGLSLPRISASPSRVSRIYRGKLSKLCLDVWVNPGSKVSVRVDTNR